MRSGQQDCLTPAILGPARAHCTTTIGGITIHEGEIILPSPEAAAVTIDNLRLKKIIIVDKDPNDFRPGFWDIDLKYVFVYTLTFRDASGEIIGCIKANSIFNKQVTLFGSVGTDIVIGTDLLGNRAETLDADPFVLCEGKAPAMKCLQLRTKSYKERVAIPHDFIYKQFDKASFERHVPDFTKIASYSRE